MTTGDDDPGPPSDPPDPSAPPGPGDPEPGGAAPAPPSAASPGRRVGWPRSTDRYVGGVAGGLADALDVDPIVVRLGLVVGTLYLPVLVVAYAFAWLVLPDERTGASLLRAARSPEGWRPVAGIVALAVGVTMLAPDLGPGGDGALTIGVLLAGIGILLVLRHPGDATLAGSEPPPPFPPSDPAGWPDPSAAPVGTAWTDPTGGPSALDAGADPEADIEAGGSSRARRVVPPLERLVHDRFRRRRRPPSPLGWLGLSALVVLVGVVAAVDRGIEPVAPGVAVSLGLLLVGVVLLVAAWRGRARLLILPGLAILPLWVGFSLSDVPHYEHDGDASYVVASGDELRRAYEHGYGQMDVDLRAVTFEPGEHRSLRLGLTGGQVDLLLPAALELRIDGDMGLGHLEVWDPYDAYVAYEDTAVVGDAAFHDGPAVVPCTEQDVYGPATVNESGNYVPGEVVRREHLTPRGEPCEPQPPVKDPPVLEVTLDVGIGTVEVHRATA